MKLHGTHLLHAPRQRVWDALADPAVLVRTIPGCQTLRETAPGSYAARVHAGVASITGTYDGRVELTEQDAPSSYVLRVTGSGTPGTIDATARVRLRDGGDGTTTVEYHADAVVGGAVGGVGQRVLAGVARRNADAFFAAVDEHLRAAADAAGAPAGAQAGDADAPARGVPAPAGTAAPAGVGQVYSRPAEARPAWTPGPLALLAAALLGAAIALLGVLAGRHTAR